MILPSGGQPPAGLLAARGLAALRAYLVVSVTIIRIFYRIVALIMELTCKGNEKMRRTATFLACLFSAEDVSWIGVVWLPVVHRV
jgi:hypothetical protein